MFTKSILTNYTIDIGLYDVPKYTQSVLNNYTKC